MTLETGKPIGKNFSTTLFSKDLLPLFSSELIQIFPFSETIPLSFFDHTKIRRMRPPQEVQDIGQLRPLQNEEDFTVYYNNGNYNGWRLRRLGEFEGPVEFSRFVWPRKATLMELGRLWKLSIPEIKVYRRKTGTWSMRTQSFAKKTLRQEISTMEDSSWQWQGQKHGYPWCHRHWYYGHRAELSMHFFGRIGW